MPRATVSAALVALALAFASPSRAAAPMSERILGEWVLDPVATGEFIESEFSRLAALDREELLELGGERLAGFSEMEPDELRKEVEMGRRVVQSLDRGMIISEGSLEVLERGKREAVLSTEIVRESEDRISLIAEVHDTRVEIELTFPVEDRLRIRAIDGVDSDYFLWRPAGSRGGEPDPGVSTTQVVVDAIQLGLEGAAEAPVSEPARVDDLQKALKGRWEGAWVLATSEVVSNCDGSYSNNSAQGGRLTGEGAARFPSGELGRVHRVDVHRSRIDVLIDLEEALLVSRQDGPFTLYEEVRCRIELELEVPREVVKERRLDLAEAALGEVLQAFPTVEEARVSSGWNGRERGAYPADYETTLAEYQAWRMERRDQGVEARLEEALDRAARYFGFLLRDPKNGETFATGARSVAGRLPDDCASLLTIDEGSLPTIAGSPRARDAYVAGQRMAFYLELAIKLRGCLSKGS